MAIPASGYIGDAARTKGEQKTALEEIVAFLNLPAGMVAPEETTIASGAIVPPRRWIALRGQGGTADVLDTIDATGFSNGDFLHIQQGSAVEPITLAETGNIKISETIAGVVSTVNCGGTTALITLQWDSGTSKFMLAFHSGIRAALILDGQKWTAPLGTYRAKATGAGGGAGAGGGGGSTAGIDGTDGTDMVFSISGGADVATFSGGQGGKGGIQGSYPAPGGQGGTGGGQDGRPYLDLIWVGQTTGGQGGLTPLPPFGQGGAGGNGVGGGGGGGGGAGYAVQFIEVTPLMSYEANGGDPGTGGAAGTGANAGADGQPGALLLEW